jgi:hypothetical protein
LEGILITHIPNVSDLSSITSRFAPKAAPIVYQNIKLLVIYMTDN